MSDDSWSTLDKIDQKIIEILNKNARTPSKDIAMELQKSGHDVSDRTIRKRIERLEKSGIIKGYKAVLTDVSGTGEYEFIVMKLKPSKSIQTTKDTITEFVKKLDDYLFVASTDGEWNMVITVRIESDKVNTSQKIIEKFSEDLIDYRIMKINFHEVNLLNMSLLLL